MYVGVDVGGTKTLIAVFDEAGEVVREQKFPTNENYETFIDELCAHIQEMLKSPQELQAIGVAVPGLVDYNSGTVRKFGNLAWKDVGIKQSIAERYEVPIAIDNDANVGAIFEARQGSGKGYHEVLYVTISTGIGTGVAIDGKIDPALADSEGGQMHFEHDGQLMVWEKFASGKAFKERYGKLGAEIDDPGIWREWSADVSLGIGSLLASIRPAVLVIGGSMGVHLPKYHDFLVEHLKSAKSHMVDIPPIVAALDPERAVILGCNLIARDLVEAS